MDSSAAKSQSRTSSRHNVSALESGNEALQTSTFVVLDETCFSRVEYINRFQSNASIPTICIDGSPSPATEDTSTFEIRSVPESPSTKEASDQKILNHTWSRGSHSEENLISRNTNGIQGLQKK